MPGAPSSVLATDFAAITPQHSMWALHDRHAFGGKEWSLVSRVSVGLEEYIYCPKNQGPSKVKVLRVQTPATQGQNLP